MLHWHSSHFDDQCFFLMKFRFWVFLAPDITAWPGSFWDPEFPSQPSHSSFQGHGSVQWCDHVLSECQLPVEMYATLSGCHSRWWFSDLWGHPKSASCTGLPCACRNISSIEETGCNGHGSVECCQKVSGQWGTFLLWWCSFSSFGSKWPQTLPKSLGKSGDEDQTWLVAFGIQSLQVWCLVGLGWFYVQFHFPTQL